MNRKELTENIILILNHDFEQLDAAPGNILFFKFAGFPLKENIENFLAFDALYSDTKLLIEIRKSIVYDDTKLLIEVGENRISIFEHCKLSSIATTEFSRELERFLNDNENIQQLLKQIKE